MKVSGLKITRLLTAVTALFTLTFSSCESIYDYEGDCEPKHKVRFVYDMNLKWADAFPSEVKSVNLYLFDEDGLFVTEYLGRGEELSNPGYLMDLDVPAGKSYTFVAWGGLYNEGAEKESFTVTDPVEGVTKLDDFICTMNTLTTPPTTKAGEDAEVAKEYSDSRLYFLYHGMLEDEFLADDQEGLTYIHTIYLTKDTNHIRVILQELDHDGIKDPDAFEVSIENVDGVMAYNNDLLGNTPIEFLPWYKAIDWLGIGSIDEENATVTNKPGLVTDLSVGRMMDYQKDSMMLTIKNKAENKIVARVPVIQYALLQRVYYEEAYGHQMSEQEFLDRQDEYVLTFFLQGGKWIYATIDILQWRLVIHNYDLEGN